MDIITLFCEIDDVSCVRTISSTTPVERLSGFNGMQLLRIFIKLTLTHLKGMLPLNTLMYIKFTLEQ